MKVRLTKNASKSLDKIPDRIAEKIYKAAINLGDDPYPNQSKKLSGEENYRLRVGVYRAIYTIYKKEELIVVLRIRHRREVYR